ncbi:MAG: hypothetical protein A3F42_01415 [Gammaproteobacteria bacterium RIFCSPHIGHO2_12_FULL_37_34]|nr:MAG: hypothetical protein A3F42_01415 [Gammaproteobacteria bacterium RIFCSPHIGHO2_12_FULL_37_34]
MPKKINTTQQDIDAFQKAVKGTRLLIQKKVRLTTHSTHPSKKHNIHNDLEDIILDEPSTIQSVSGEASIIYKHSSISHKRLRKLKKGQYNVEAVLDLHGMSVEKARIAITHFLQDCLNQEQRVVLIIHGKGRHHSKPPILKNKLNHWLRHLTIVLAFSAAPPAQGGGGATVVLLKNISRRRLIE